VFAVLIVMLVLAASLARMFSTPIFLRFGPTYIAAIFAGTFISVLCGAILLGKGSSWVALWLLVVIALVASLAPPTIPILSLSGRNIRALAYFAGGILGYVLTRCIEWKQSYVRFWPVVLCGIWGMFVAGSWGPTTAFVSQQVADRRGSDQAEAVRMFYLMKGGVGYYEAYIQSVMYTWRLDAQGIAKCCSSYFSWRGPFLNDLWLLLPNAQALYGAYALLGILAVVSSYFAFDKLSGKAAIAGASMILPYLGLGIGAIAIGSDLQNSLGWMRWESWGALFGLLAFAFYFRGHRRMGVVPAFFAAACKETLVFSLLAGLLGSSVRKDTSEFVTWLGGLTAFGTYSLWHYSNLYHYLHLTVSAEPTAGLARWAGNGGILFVENTFRAATRWSSWPGWFFVIFALAILGVVIIRPLHLSVFAFTVAIAPVLFMMVVGNKSDAYWGITYVPFVLLMACYAAANVDRLSRIGKSVETWVHLRFRATAGE
jgi:hypothetical protein